MINRNKSEDRGPRTEDPTPIATIDIGTNSVLLLITEIHSGNIHPIKQDARISRLGEGLSETGVLSETAMERTLSVLRDYAMICKEMRAIDIYAVGTAAMRNAKNGKGFAQRIIGELEIPVEIITDQREAQLTFIASAHSFGREISLIDVGGGSTEFILGNVGRKEEVLSQSLGLGVVALAERFLRENPTTEDELASVKDYVRNFLKKNLDSKFFQTKGRKLVATAGTPTTLAAIHKKLDPYDPAKVHGMELNDSDIDSIIAELMKLTLKQRKSLKGLQLGREDVILPGAVIIRTAMELMDFANIIVSDRGVRWGLLYEKII
jgi:exopolyphosphatase/guanosine-5'-triphosphate,3'-diphosphate pyrophosphatase